MLSPLQNNQLFFVKTTFENSNSSLIIYNVSDKYFRHKLKAHHCNYSILIELDSINRINQLFIHKLVTKTVNEPVISTKKLISLWWF